ncbi:hypothetical protein [Streptomyces sp. NPDC096033]|uniref:hypothetical protein n=1 Tax=Streptomyces sp. NPDC096033 TaxID=3366071 RepID=UPI003829980F
MLNELLYGSGEPRLPLLTGDEARALVILLGALEEVAPSEGVRLAAGDMRFRIGSRLA